jgi:hypothetical protein
VEFCGYKQQRFCVINKEIIVITPSFSLTATERVLPRLALDFTTASLDPRVTFTRAANTATVVNSSGYVVGINANLPRFDYDPVTLVCKGLLIEEARTNSLTYSSTFTNAAWFQGGLTLVGASTTAPDNTLTGTRAFAASNNQTFQLGIVFNGAAWTASIFAKYNGVATFKLNIYDNVAGSAGTVFNIQTGAIVSNNVGVTSTITNFGNGWYRCAITRTPANLSSGGLVIDSTTDIFVWGAQVEAGSFSTSYIPTVASTVLRNADVATMTGANFSDWWQATTGALAISSIPISIIGIKPLFQIDDNTADNIINLRGNAANPELYIKATTDQVQIDAGTIVANTAYKLSGAWNTDSCAASQNGAAVVTDNTATIPTVTQVRIGSDGTNYANAQLQKILYWPQRLINAEVQAFSK